MRFDYYYGSQADQFSFIRIPRVLLKDPAFANLSVYAKMLYSVLLDRMSLSSKNGWFDEENRVYIVYPITEAQEDLGIGKKKAMEVISELVEFGLLEKKRRGQGLPSLLYVKSFMTGIDNSRQEETEPARSEVPEQTLLSSAQPEGSGQAAKSMTLGETKNPERTIQVTALGEAEASGSAPQNPDMEDPEVSDKALQKPSLYSSESVQPSSAGLIYAAETALSAEEARGTDYSVQYGPTGSEVPKREFLEVPESTLLEVPKSAPLMSKTDKNYTYRSYLSHLINAGSTEPTGKADGKRWDGNAAEGNPSKGEKGDSTSDGSGKETLMTEAQRIQAYRELICDNICYEDLCRARQYDRERIDGIVDLILEIVLGKDEYVRIASNCYPVEIVRSRFLKLGYEHIEYVLDCLDSNTTKVKNIKKYLLAVLFNAPSTMKGYYHAEVNHDMPQYAKPAQYA